MSSSALAAAMSSATKSAAASALSVAGEIVGRSFGVSEHGLGVHLGEDSDLCHPASHLDRAIVAVLEQLGCGVQRASSSCRA